ncbi:MAG: MGMT family protein [Richelia sp.]|nr:MGMT family protein [Richelia sp.]
MCRASDEIIYTLARQIPYRKVATYGQIAELAHMPGKPRVVGYALLPVDLGVLDIRWHPVVNFKGKISYSPIGNGADKTQKVLLEAEGVEFTNKGKINEMRLFW